MQSNPLETASPILWKHTLIISPSNQGAVTTMGPFPFICLTDMTGKEKTVRNPWSDCRKWGGKVWFMMTNLQVHDDKPIICA